ncbi:MAG: flavin reductase family protein [Opitutaceae bacterium]|nr:flavin reductase family protein [Opitutaceae bacterium]
MAPPDRPVQLSVNSRMSVSTMPALLEFMMAPPSRPARLLMKARSVSLVFAVSLAT